MKLLKIGASWCGPCQTMDKLLKDFTMCEVVYYDVENEDDETQGVIDRFTIRNIPVMVLVDDNGEEIKRWNGLTKIADIENEIKSHE